MVCDCFVLELCFIINSLASFQPSPQSRLNLASNLDDLVLVR